MDKRRDEALNFGRLGLEFGLGLAVHLLLAGHDIVTYRRSTTCRPVN